MKLILSTHNVTLTKAIEDHIVGKLEKLAKIERFAINARVVLDQDNNRAPETRFGCSIRLSMRGPDLFAEDWESDLYAAIDLSAKKVEQQIRKRHDKRKAMRKKAPARAKLARQMAV
jgi:putative sigma-54 modulation protein